MFQKIGCVLLPRCPQVVCITDLVHSVQQIMIVLVEKSAVRWIAVLEVVEKSVSDLFYQVII